jgi:hypothetical protein
MGDPSEFCAKMEDWAKACMTHLPTDDEAKKQWREEFAQHWLWLHRAIIKSNLLWRLMYEDEKLRTVPCPIHKGRWSGCTLPADSGCNGACMSGANVTGWLPEANTPKAVGPILIVNVEP